MTLSACVDGLARTLQDGVASLDDIIAATHVLVESLNPAAVSIPSPGTAEVPLVSVGLHTGEVGGLRILSLSDDRTSYDFWFERPSLPEFIDLSPDNSLQLRIGYTFVGARLDSCGALVQNLLHHTASTLERLREHSRMQVGGAYQVFWQDGDWTTHWRPLLLEAVSAENVETKWTSSSGSGEPRPSRTLDGPEVESVIVSLQAVRRVVGNRKDF